MRQPDISSALLDAVERGVEDETQTSLVEFPIVLTAGKTSSCFKTENPFEGGTEETIFIKDGQARPVFFSMDNENLIIQGTGEKLYYLYFSEDEKTQTDDPGCVSPAEPGMICHIYSVVFCKSEVR